MEVCHRTAVVCFDSQLPALCPKTFSLGLCRLPVAISFHTSSLNYLFSMGNTGRQNGVLAGYGSLALSQAAGRRHLIEPEYSNFVLVPEMNPNINYMEKRASLVMSGYQFKQYFIISP